MSAALTCTARGPSVDFSVAATTSGRRQFVVYTSSAEKKAGRLVPKSGEKPSARAAGGVADEIAPNRLQNKECSASGRGTASGVAPFPAAAKFFVTGIGSSIPSASKYVSYQWVVRDPGKARRRVYRKLGQMSGNLSQKGPRK